MLKKKDLKIDILNKDDKSFPKELKKIKDVPDSLYVLGNKKLLNTKAISIVGSRDCTKEGVENALVFAANLANAGFTIVSGMAKGIDRAAHMRCFKSSRKYNCCIRMWCGLYIS